MRLIWKTAEAEGEYWAFIHVEGLCNFRTVLVDDWPLIRQFCIMLLYRYLLHYGLLLHIMSQYLWLFSLILQGLHKEGECRQLGFWAGKGANIRDLFCTAPKVLKLTEDVFQIHKKYWAEGTHQGATPCPRGWGRALPPGRAPYLVGPLVALRWPSSAIWSLSMGKNS